MDTGEPGAVHSFAERLVVVTGGGSGIGAASAAALADAGAQVVVADIDHDAAQAVAGETGGQARHVDVRDRDSVSALISSLPRAPDGLLTCAGGAVRCPAIEVDEELLLSTLQLNAGGFWRCAQESARRAVEEGRRLAIVHVASSLYAGPAPGLSHFAAAKGASISLVRCLAQEWAVHGIRVNAIVPGPVDTPATGKAWAADPAVREAVESRIPMGRIGRTADLIPAVTWLLHDAAEWITGSLVSIDGGWSIAQ